MNDEPLSNDTSKAVPGASVKGLPFSSTFGDLFSGGRPVWLKIGGAAIATPLIVFGIMRKSQRRGGPAVDSTYLPYILAASGVIGAFVGTALCMKDIVEKRMAAGEKVAFPLKLAFGYGIGSALLWAPFVLVVGIAAAIATIGL